MNAVRPLLSIVVPAYNSAPWLGECVDSALAGEPRDEVEVVVVDDGSIDATPQVLMDLARRHGPSMRLLRQENAGPSAARNAGRAVARGEFLLYLDADDYLLPGGLDALLHVLRSTSATLVVTGWNAPCARTGAVLDRSAELLPYADDPLASLIKVLRPVSALVVRGAGAAWDPSRKVWEVMRWMNRSAIGAHRVAQVRDEVSAYRQNHTQQRLSIVEPHMDPVVTGDFWLEELRELGAAGALSPLAREALDEKLMACAYVAVRMRRHRDAVRFVAAIDHARLRGYRWVRRFGATGFGANFGVAGLRVFAAVNRLLGRA
jgi:glycosyltransferase involved in cell wall biosynthesis